MILGFIEAQQIIVLVPLFGVALPGTLNTFFGYIMRVASFDLLPVDEYLSGKIKMTPRDPINCAYEAIGFETMYTLMNLGTMLIILMLFPALALIEVSLKFCKCSCSQKMRQKL